MKGNYIHTRGGGGNRYLDSKHLRSKSPNPLLLAFLFIFGFTISVFAVGGGGGLSGITYTETGQTYRCFANIGYAKSTSQGLLTGQYCLPSSKGDACTKEWDWSVDSKNDSVKYNDCKIQCREKDDAYTALGTGSKNPFDTYNYCVKSSEWSKVAKCIARSNGAENPSSLCDSDTNGTNYYYKPRCDIRDTKEQCTNRLKTINPSGGWKFCYTYTQPSPPQGMFSKRGGQSVEFKEYRDYAGSATFPCELNSNPPSGGSAAPTDKPTTPTEPLGNLVIIDWADSQKDTSLIHTKISGNAYNFKIYASNASGKISSGLQSVTCEIPEVSGTRTNASVAFNLKSMIVYKYSVGENVFSKSGNYTIKCEGANKEGEKVSATVSFLVAPNSYNFSVISAEFKNTTSSLSSGGIVSESLLSKPTTIDYNKTQIITHDNNNWTKKPIVKIGENFSIIANEITALTKRGTTDSGVDGTKSIGGVISIDLTNSKFNNYAIKDSSTIPPTTATSNTCTAKSNLNPNEAEMVEGILKGNESILTATFDNAVAGKADITIYDKAMQTLIEQEKASGKCIDNHNNFPCPYPARLQVNFDYQVVPLEFKTELLDKNNKPLKVIYFGQGQTPAVESPTNLKITALSSDAKTGTIATGFDSQCASQNLTLNMELDGVGFSIKVIDKDGNDLIIKGDKFKNGEAIVESIIQVNKSKDVPFTPNMKSEPVFTGDKYPDGFPSKMEFSGFPPANTYYPSYDAKVNPNDPLLILRGRINAIDTDNAPKFGVANPQKVYYEFQCEYCNLDAVGKITGVNNYERSKTQQGWWIDKTFSIYNATQITKDKLEIENLGNGQVKAVSGVTNGFQDIAYNFLANGTYKLNIRHGNFLNGTTAIAMPNFLLYNAYWNESVKWNTSSFIYIKGKADDEQRNYGVDTGGAKNTRSGGRIGRY